MILLHLDVSLLQDFVNGTTSNVGSCKWKQWNT